MKMVLNPVAIEGESTILPIILKGELGSDALEVVDQTDEKTIQIEAINTTDGMTILETIFHPKLPGLHLIKITIDTEDGRQEAERIIPVVRDEIQKQRLVTYQEVKQTYIIDNQGDVKVQSAT